MVASKNAAVRGEGRDSSIGKSSTSYAGDPGSNPSKGLDSGHTNMHE